MFADLTRITSLFLSRTPLSGSPSPTLFILVYDFLHFSLAEQFLCISLSLVDTCKPSTKRWVAYLTWYEYWCFYCSKRIDNMIAPDLSEVFFFPLYLHGVFSSANFKKCSLYAGKKITVVIKHGYVSKSARINERIDIRPFFLL